MFFLLPSLPVFFHVSVVNPFVPAGLVMAIILGQAAQTTGNFPGLYIFPIPPVVPGSVQVPFKGTPPVPLKEQHVNVKVRDHVNICPRNNNHLRRSSKPDRGKIDPNTYIHLGFGFGCNS
jgi:hypothetical protein